MNEKCQLLVISKGRITGEALRQALSSRDGKYDVSLSSSYHEPCPGQKNPAIVLLTCAGDCPFRVKTCLSLYPQARYIIIANAPDEDQQLQWLKDGAYGIVDESRSEVSLELLDTIVREVRSGILWAPRRVALRLADNPRAPLQAPGRARVKSGGHGLTMREKELLDLLLAGLSNAEIADRLFISVRTVKGHLTHIYRKLGVANRLQATLKLTNIKLTNIRKERLPVDVAPGAGA